MVTSYICTFVSWNVCRIITLRRVKACESGQARKIRRKESTFFFGRVKRAKDFLSEFHDVSVLYNNQIMAQWNKIC